VSVRRVAAELDIAGMVAVHSVRAVYTALGGVPGVLTADVSMGHAAIVHDGTVVRDAVAAAVAIVGCELTGWREGRGGLPVL
jgi:copper chaperone CopZ